RAALRRRWKLHLALAAGWLLLAGQVLDAFRPTHPDEQRITAGFAMKGLTPIEYVRNQPGVVLHYLRLAAWPHPLCVDYDWPRAESFTAVAPAALTVLALLGGPLWAWVRRPARGFLGAWFFLPLAPTSSIMRIADLAAERRMYLPLAALAVLAAVGGWWAVRALAAHAAWDDRVRR